MVVALHLTSKLLFLDVPSLADVTISVEVRGMPSYSAFQPMSSLKQLPLRHKQMLF